MTQGWFLRLALIASALAFVVVILGAYVRLSDAGLGCPDWPRCFGRWIPPLSPNQIPTGYDAAAFNFTLAWIEYINRLIGVVVGLLILVTAILAILYFRKNLKLFLPSILAVLLVAFQGWYGSVVVESHLLPMTVSIHMILALLIVSLLIYVSVHASYMHRLPVVDKNKILPLKRLIILVWVVSLIQIILGTEIRSSIENIWHQFPLLQANEVLARLDVINYLHTILGILLVMAVVITSFRILQLRPVGITLRQSTWIMTILIILQIIIGLSLQLIGLPAILQVFHLWIASLFIGVLLIIYSDLSFQQELS